MLAVTIPPSCHPRWLVRHGNLDEAERVTSVFERHADRTELQRRRLRQRQRMAKERKWQIVAAVVGTAIFGMLFEAHTASFGLVVLGILIILMNSFLGYCSQAYQSELFPTRMQARAVGLVYSWGRLSTAFTSLIIGFLFQRFRTAGVFVFIALAMFAVVVSVGVFGPRTHGLALEQISD